MSDWRQRATITIDPMVESRNAILAQNASGKVPINPNQTLPPVQGTTQPVVTSDWRSRATITPAAAKSDWRSRATITPGQKDTGGVDIMPSMATVTKAALPMIGIGGRLRADYASRDQEIQKSVDATANGQQGEVQMGVQNALSNASKFTDTAGEVLGAVPFVGPAITKGFNAATDLIGKGLASVPSERFQQGVMNVGDMLQADTPTGRNIRAAGQTVNLAGAATGARAAGNAVEGNVTARPGVQKFMADETSGKQPPKLPMQTAADTAKIAGQDYDTANYVGGKFTPDQVANKFDSSLKQAMPKPLPNGALTSEGQKFANSLKEFEGMVGKEFTLEDVDNLNKSFNQKINNHIDPRTGAPDADGKMLMDLQTKLRKSVTDIPNNTGNDALLNGRDAWHTKVMMQDLELVGDRASVAPGDKAKALQAGYRALYNDKDRIASWPKEAVALLKEAATPNVATKVLTATLPRITAAIMGASGNVAGAAGAQLAGFAGGTAAEAIAASRGASVQRALGDAMMKKRRDVNIPAPEYPVALQLAAPGKLSPLPMSDAQVSISQQLMEKTGKVSPGSDLSGSATKTPVSQVGKLEGSLKGIKQGQLKNMKASLLSGELSQNKFVETSTKAFGLSTKQARELAKEILTYGAKK